MTRRLTPPLKWHGGKQYLAARIVALMPQHLHYAEPFAGGLAVLLERDPNDISLWVSQRSDRRGVSEVVNDINNRLTNFWQTLRSEELFPRLLRIAQATPLARQTWEEAHSHAHGQDPLKDAWAFFVDCRQSRAGTFKGFTSLTRNRTRRGINGNASEWLSAIEGLPAVHARLQPVTITNMDAIDFIRREDTPHTLFYCDPPYLHQTRTATDAYGQFEMTEQDHRELLDLLRECEGKVMLSGYASELYDQTLADWTRHTFDLPNHAAGGATKRRMTEVLWCNF
jgi:DNA adenine methylase